MTTATISPPKLMQSGTNPMLQTAMILHLGQALIWAFLFFRWLTFGSFGWTPIPLELTLAQWPPIVAYVLYSTLFVVDLVIGFGLWRKFPWAIPLGTIRSAVVIVLAIVYFLNSSQLYEASIILALAGFGFILLRRSAPWSLAFPAAFWLAIFFVAPMLIVLVVSLGERARLGTVVYPAFELTNLGVYFNDYARFFSRINGEFIYLRIFWRSVGLATLNTVVSLAFGYPFAYWIARQPQRWRAILIFLVMIPFWTNFLVRTYAWILILRDSGLINNFWTITLHDMAVQLSDTSAFFAWLAVVTSDELPLLFNQGAVILGLFYGYIPLAVLPIYSNLEKMDWSLLEAAADLGANAWYSTMRILLPITRPGIVAAAILVFIPSLGAYVTPDLLGGAKVALLGNLLQQQFMTVRDWPFGAAIGFIMLAMMMLAIVIYFRVADADESLA